MSFNTIYKPLTEVVLLHNYLLNDGDLIFSMMNSKDQKKQLIFYDLSEFIEITPNQKTLDRMAGHKLVFKKHKSGFVIYCKVNINSQKTPFINIPDTLKLTFTIKLNDTIFRNYTDLTGGLKDLFYFGNVKPDTEGINYEHIAKNNQNKLVTDDYILSPLGKAEILKMIDDDGLSNVFGVIQLFMKGDNTNLSLLTNQGKLKNTIPVFKIQFKNKFTFWRYKKSEDDSEIFTTVNEQPLTKNGFIEVIHNGDLYPNPNANHLVMENNKIFSEIYI